MTIDSCRQVSLLFDEIPTVCPSPHLRPRCLPRRLPAAPRITTQPLRFLRRRAAEVVPDPEPLLLWISPTATRDRHPLSDWCATVGPVLDHRRPPSDLPAFVDRLAVVTWNVHVGFGDVRELIRRLQSGAYTGGEGIEHFVLLLQEAYRRDGGVPARTSVRLRLPARVGAQESRQAWGGHRPVCEGPAPVAVVRPVDAQRRRP